MGQRGNYRDYGTEEKAASIAVLAACNGNSWVASKETGVPRKTLEHWWKQDKGISEDTAKMAVDKTIELGDWFENHARKCLHLADARVEDPEVPYTATITGAAIAVDKMRLLREQSTSITEDRKPKSIEERDRLLMALLDEIDRNAIDIEPDACDS